MSTCSLVSRVSGRSRATWRSEQIPVNPFKLDVPRMSIPELFIRVLLTIVLLPIRVFAMSLGVIGLLYPVALLMTYGQDMTVPPSGFRRLVLLYFYRPAIRLVYLFTGVWIQVKGKCALPDEAPIIVTAPHASFFDPCMVWVTSYSPAIVTKNDVLDIPFLGKIISSSQPVWIDRYNSDARKTAVMEIKSRARSNGQWPQLMLFPEGTTSSGQALITFKPGAFLPGVAVQPVAITIPDYMIWTWDSPGALFIMWRVLTTLITVAQVEFLPVYVPNEEEKKDVKLYAANVRAFMADRIHKEMSDLGFEDCRLIQAAKGLHLPLETVTIDVVAMSEALGVTIEEIIHELKHFALEASKQAEGRITLTAFGDLIRVPMGSLGAPGICAQVFMTFEKAQTGLMSFKEYLAFMSLAKKIGDDLDVGKIADLVGEDDEPYNYEELAAATKVVAWRRRLDPSRINATAAKLVADVKAIKQRQIDDKKFEGSISASLNQNRSIMDS